MNTSPQLPNSPRRRGPAIVLGLLVLLIVGLLSVTVHRMSSESGETSSVPSGQTGTQPDRTEPPAAERVSSDTPPTPDVFTRASEKQRVRTASFAQLQQGATQRPEGDATKQAPKPSSTLDAGDHYAIPGGTVKLLRQRGWLAVHHGSAVNGQELAETLTSPTGPLKDFVLDKVPGQGVLLFRASAAQPVADAEAESALAATRQVASVRSVTPVFTRADEGLQLLPTEQFIVQLQQGTSPSPPSTPPALEPVQKSAVRRSSLQSFFLTNLSDLLILRLVSQISDPVG